MPNFKVEEKQNLGTSFTGKTDYHITLTDGEQKVLIKTSNRAAADKFVRGAFYRIDFQKVENG